VSGTTATARRLPNRAATKPRPRLIVVASPRAAGKAPFVALVGGLLLAGLLSLLMLHTLAAQDSFRQTSLQQRLANLNDSEQRLEQQVQLDSAPSALREKARALGMVPSAITHYRQLPNGRTVAREVPASSVGSNPVVATTTSDTKSTDSKVDATAKSDGTAKSTGSKVDATAKSGDTKSDGASKPEKTTNSDDTGSISTKPHGPHGAAQR